MERTQEQQRKEMDEILKQLKRVYKGAKDKNVKSVIKSKLIPNLEFRLSSF